ncbi:MerR family transcriptional regulator [Eupransor demetentiae]|uniref:MerR family (SoxR) n=1 Tax=Eupransor demetentiae TaxID=3109584 RepID=A0ABM9N460_9LACO|nr:DNA-binding transcriptional regulator [Lactobacillaceae bacterium LMG 33000]
MSYSIGQVAEMYKLPVSTVRYYDKMGLFPGLKRESGFRRFSNVDVQALNLIDCLKKSGLSITDIKDFMDLTTKGPSTFEERRELFIEQEATVEKELAEIKKVQAMLQFKHWYYDEAIKLGNEEAVQAMIPDQLPKEIRAAYQLSHN